MELTCSRCKQTKDIKEFTTFKTYQSHVCDRCSQDYRNTWKKAKRRERQQIHTLNKDLIAGGQKRCHHCLTVKSLAEFGFITRKGQKIPHGSCKPCRALMEKSVKLKGAYGLSLDDYKLLLEGQNHRCAVCLTSFKDVRKVCVDHDHNTDEVRGLLCDHCNRGLGLLKDDRQVLQRAIDYLNAGPFKIPLNGEPPEVANPVLNLVETPEDA